MRNIILAVTISLTASAVLYLLATAVGLPADLAKGMAGLAAFATKDLHEFLETRTAKFTFLEVDYKSVPKLQDFSIRTSSMLVMASLVFAAMRVMSNAIEGLLLILYYGDTPSFT